MCNILFLPKNTPISVEPIRNMVINNPDGYGLLVKDSDGTVREAIKSFDKNGTNPDQVIHYLKTNKDKDRLLHVRFNTVGESSLENTHPFVVHRFKERTIFMMHNGTMYDFKPPANADHVKDWSDSRFFANTFANSFFENHVPKGNYSKGIAKSILSKFVGGTSKVVFWGSGLEPMFIGPWIFKHNTDGTVNYVTSNEDYFDKIIHGRSVSARREAATSTPFRGYGTMGNYQGTGSTGYSSSNYTQVKTYYKSAIKQTYTITEPEVGNTANSFFTQSVGNQINGSLRKHVENFAQPNAASRTTTPIVRLSELKIRKTDLTESIVEELKKMSDALETLDPESIYDVDGFASLCHVTPAEWNTVIAKYPDSCGNLMLLLSYACAEMYDKVSNQAEKAHRQELHIERLVKQLKDTGGNQNVAA